MIEPGIPLHFQKSYPSVLLIGGHDPSGGAGIIADAQAALAMRTWPLTLVTCLTAQNTERFDSLMPQSPADFLRQLDLLLQDFQPAAVKLGVLGNLALQKEITHWLKQAQLPLVIDPVMASGSGTGLLESREQLHHLRDQLLPLAQVVTPNIPELAQLAPQHAEVDAQAKAILKSGCRAVLVTGTHAPTRTVKNLLYRQGTSQVMTSRWTRLEGEYHGSGCTLAAALAALLARGEALDQAITQAQDFTWHSLEQGVQLTQGQKLPLRKTDFFND